MVLVEVGVVVLIVVAGGDLRLIVGLLFDLLLIVRSCCFVRLDLRALRLELVQVDLRGGDDWTYPLLARASI